MEIESLKKAYYKSPDNSALLALLMGAMRDNGQWDEAYEVLEKSSCELSEQDERLVAGEICLKAGKADAVLDYCTGGEWRRINNAGQGVSAIAQP